MKKKTMKKGKNSKELVKQNKVLIKIVNIMGFVLMTATIMMVFFAVKFEMGKYNNENPKGLEYNYCLENYMYGGFIGKLCCVSDPYESLQNKCAYYYNRGEKIDKPKEVSEDYKAIIQAEDEIRISC